ncbi:MAG: hypothetical protein JOZ09_06740 [Pseudonocardiales bacterium]|nr:hypothetical protein [Pseudonocardiales bacterium]
MMKQWGSNDALEAELASRIDAEGRIAAALLELESHPGHHALSTAVLTGQTAQRWAEAREILAGLWQDFGIYQAVVSAARTVRARRARPGERELAELHRLLAQPSIDVARTAVSLSERRLTGAIERVEMLTLDQLSARMDTAFAEISELVLACDATQRAVLTALTTLAKRVSIAQMLADDLGTAATADLVTVAITTLAAEIDNLGRVCVTDPLSLAGQQGREVLTALEDRAGAVSAQLAELAAVRDGWEDRLAELAATVDEIDTLRVREEQARQRAQELIADAGLVTPPNRLPVLRSRLAALPDLAGWPARALAVTEMQAVVESAVSELSAAYEQAITLEHRRAELRGRFEAYRAKATRLGCAEHSDALALDASIRQLLWTKPCDLAAATRALVAYQRLVSGMGRPA